MTFKEKLKQSTVIIILIMVVIAVVGVIYNETINIYEWSKNSKFYACSFFILSVIYCLAYFAEDRNK